MDAILVTGGCGFIGSSIVRSLVSQGYKVHVLDNGSRGRESRLQGLDPRVQFFQGDVRDPQVVESAIRGCRTVIHLAYVNGTRYFYEDPYRVLEVATLGMLNVLASCRAHFVERFFLASTSEVYQTPTRIPTPEEVPLSVPDVLNPRYSYGGGKILNELLLANFDDSTLVDRIIFRPHNVYGPDMGREHVIPMIIEKILRAQKLGHTSISIQGNGTQTRSFMYIEDFVDGFTALLEGAHGRLIVNVGTEEEITITQLIQAIQEILGTSLTLEPTKAPRGETPRRCPDTSVLASFGVEPRVPLIEGLRRTIDWYVRNPDSNS